MDTHDSVTRSFNMSRIGSRDTRPELLLRRAVWALGVRGYRLHAPLIGRPDLVITRARLAVFVDGCFWHGCRRCRRRPVDTNAGYWNEKILKNRRRDVRVARALRREGWQVIRFWEHDVERDPNRCAERVSSIVAAADQQRRAQ